jgi:hypothetical protein
LKFADSKASPSGTCSSPSIGHDSTSSTRHFCHPWTPPLLTKCRWAIAIKN